MQQVLAQSVRCIMHHDSALICSFESPSAAKLCMFKLVRHTFLLYSLQFYHMHLFFQFHLMMSCPTNKHLFPFRGCTALPPIPSTYFAVVRSAAAIYHHFSGERRRHRGSSSGANHPSDLTRLISTSYLHESCKYIVVTLEFILGQFE